MRNIFQMNRITTSKMLKRENNFVNFSSDPRIDQGNEHKKCNRNLTGNVTGSDIHKIIGCDLIYVRMPRKL